jgi:hypothetical protein
LTHSVDELDSLKRCSDKTLKWGFTSIKSDIRELFELADNKFFNILSCNTEHRSNNLLPAQRDLCGHAKRSTGHHFQLP